jgi:CubicO group peptidase (beta-lactamase class C family)
MRSFFFIALSSAVATPLMAQQSPGPSSLQDFDRYVADAVEAWDAPGLAIAVISGDSTIFAKGYGVRRVGTNDAVSEHTLFANASTTKAFTSMVTAMMVDEGLLEWSDPVHRNWSHFEIADPAATRQLTIRHLLSHRTGFGDPSYLWYGMPTPFTGIVARLQYLVPEDGWNAGYAYNNVTYATAGAIAGRVAGSDWETLVNQRILSPLGMRETVTNTAAANTWPDVATPHDRIDGEVTAIERYDLDNIGPAGVMYSSVSDMARWIKALLDSTRVDDGRLASPESFDEMFALQTIIRPDRFYPTATLTRPHFTGYGFGWFLQDYRGEKVAFHTGSIDGMSAIVGLVPDRMIGTVVFVNLDHAELRHALMFRSFDLLMGGVDRDWSTEMRAMYDSLAAEGATSRRARIDERRPGTSPTLALERYVGSYADSLYGAVEVTLESGALRLSRSPFLTATLEHWHYDTFETVWSKPWVGRGLVTFHINAGGDVSALEIGGFSVTRTGR